MKLSILIFTIILTTFSLIGQTQIGSTILGDATEDRLGSSVTINEDGTIIAIGAKGTDQNGNNTGQVKVFENTNGDWAQLGEDIDGEVVNGLFGSHVSMSDNGTRVAIGAEGVNNNAGEVKVFENMNGIWTQVGQAIEGDESDVISSFANGIKIAMSGDGNVVAVSAPFYSDGIFFFQGMVKVYQYDGSNWVQIGNTFFGIDGELLGFSIDLDEDGSTLIFGTPGAEDGFGNARIFNNIGGEWVQVGQSITDNTTVQIGSSVNINGAGNIAVLSTDRRERVYVFELVNDAWEQVGNFISDNANNFFGVTTAISDDGNVLAVGAEGNPNSNLINAGVVRLYQRTSNNEWELFGDAINGVGSGDISGGTDEDIRLSSDGTTLIIGAQLNDDSQSNAGHARVFGIADIISSNENILENHDFKLFPNPALNQLVIESETFAFRKIAIYNSLGQEVLQIVPDDQHLISIDIRSLEGGNYFLKINSDQGVLVEQFSKVVRL